MCLLCGKVVESDGKTESARRVLALDPFTVAALRSHVEMLDRERTEFGPDYRDSGLLFCWEDGRALHPDTITRRFKKLAASAGLPEIDLHDVRHSYATVGRDAKIDWKTLSRRIGHSDVAFTMRQYVQTDLEADRQVANTLAELIIGGSLASIDIGRAASATAHAGADDRPPRQESSGDTAARAMPRLQIRLQAACRRPLP
jgi:Phage integrase family